MYCLAITLESATISNPPAAAATHPSSKPTVTVLESIEAVVITEIIPETVTAESIVANISEILAMLGEESKDIMDKAPQTILTSQGASIPNDQTPCSDSTTT